MPEKAEDQTIVFFFPFALYIIGALIFFRWQIFSHFDLLFGDRGDTRLVMFIHEHVYRTLFAGSELLSPPFFFNQTHTLGYSDAFLLDQMVYVPLRLLGAEPLLALSLTAVVLSATAYCFFFLFLRRFYISVPLASLAALIVTFPNNLYLVSLHFQLFAVYYIPIVVYCALLAVVDLHARPLRACLLGSFAAGLYGLLFSTGYYVAWFFGLALLIFAPIAVFIARPQVRTWWSKRPKHAFALGLVVGLSFFAALSIFAVIYTPVLELGAARNFKEYLFYAPRLYDIVNVGRANLVWSGVIRALHLIPDDRLGNAELFIALTPTVQILLLASVVLAFRPGFWPFDSSGRISRAFVIAGASVYAMFFLLVISVDNFSLFRVLYAIMPGANAIRVGYRDMVVATLFATTVIALTFQRIINIILQEPKTLRHVGQLVGCAALLSLAAIEQVNLAQPVHLSRKFEREHMANLAPSAPRMQEFLYRGPEEARAIRSSNRCHGDRLGSTPSNHQRLFLNCAARLEFLQYQDGRL